MKELEKKNQTEVEWENVNRETSNKERVQGNGNTEYMYEGNR